MDLRPLVSYKYVQVPISPPVPSLVIPHQMKGHSLYPSVSSSRETFCSILAHVLGWCPISSKHWLDQHFQPFPMLTLPLCLLWLLPAQMSSHLTSCSCFCTSSRYVTYAFPVRPVYPTPGCSCLSILLPTDITQSCQSGKVEQRT